VSEVEEIEPESRLDKAKEIVKKNWKPFTVGVVLTGATLIVAKRLTTYSVLIDNTGKTVRISKRAANSGMFYKVFNIYTPGFKHLGPSWMIINETTGKSFRSITMAAKEMGISPATLSQHLNGHRDHVYGHRYKKIGIAV